MKSIIQKASTIQKAVEDAWNAAGKPQEFSIRVLEHPQKGFLGFTKSPAKIALVFEEQRGREPRQREREPREGRYQQRGGRYREQPEQRETAKGAGREPREQREPRAPREPREQREPRELQRESAPEQGQQAPRQPPAQQHRLEGQWTDELVASAQKWLTEVLATMGKGNITFTTEVQTFNLRVVLSRRLCEDDTKEKHLFASFSTLMMASLKREYRRALRGHKIVIAHA